jgi:hypothetical protein
VASESLLFLQYGTRIPGLGSLAGWLPGLMAMRWPGSRVEFGHGRGATKPTGGQIMKTLRREVSAKRARRTKDWFERAKLVVVAARDRAVETTQQRAVPSKKRPPTVLQRRRLAERLVSAKSPGQCQSSNPLTSSYQRVKPPAKAMAASHTGHDPAGVPALVG